MSRFPNLDSEAAHHLEEFIRSFVDKPRRGRWYSILAMKPEKWVGVLACNVIEDRWNSDWNNPPEQVLESFNIGQRADEEAIVFLVGHGVPKQRGAKSVLRMSLREAMLGRDAVVEGIVSIVPGRLAVAIGHAGDYYLCPADRRAS